MAADENGIEAGDPSKEPFQGAFKGARKDLVAKIFGNQAYAKLFSAQTVTAIGDWLGLLALSVLAGKLGAGDSKTSEPVGNDLMPEVTTAIEVGGAATSIGFVIGARLLPGLFLSQLAGVIADRMNRQKLMIVCDLCRVGLLLLLPFVNAVWHLILISLFLELFTLLWIPAKDALLPNIVPKNRLSSANSLSFLATWGTIPLASAILLGLAQLSKVLDDIDVLNFLQITDTSIAFYVDALTFVASAFILYSMGKHISTTQTTKPKTQIGKKFWHYIVQTLKEIKDGLRHIAITPAVRGVNLGLGTALLGGGMLIPLGTIFAGDVLGAGTAGFASLIVALGIGAALGIAVRHFVSQHSKKIPNEKIFVWSATGAGLSLGLAVSFNVLWGSIVGIGFLGLFAGVLYVTGLTILHERVADNIRGRVFSSLHALTRTCVLLSMIGGPFLASWIDGIVRSVVGKSLDFGELTYAVPGIRVILWLAALMILAAGGAAARGFKHSNGKDDQEVDGK